MDESCSKLEACCRRELSLFEDLRLCLEEERQCLTRTELDSLWDLFERKMVTTRALKACDTEVRELLEASGTEAPPKTQARVRGWLMAMARLREDIRQRARENADFIGDCLSFLDELAGSLAGAGQPDIAYRPSGRRPDKGSPLIVRREV